MAITNGYCTLAEFQAYIAAVSQYSQEDDAVIEDIIEAASRLIDDETGRTFYARTETRYYSIPEGRALCLDSDLLTVTTLTNGDGAALTTADYYLYPRNSAPYFEIRLKEASSKYWALDGDGNSEYVISVAGTWGYAATAPHDIRECCLQITNSVYRRRFGENVNATSIVTPAGVIVTPKDIPDMAYRIIQRYKARL